MIDTFESRKLSPHHLTNLGRAEPWLNWWPRRRDIQTVSSKKLDQEAVVLRGSAAACIQIKKQGRKDAALRGDHSKKPAAVCLLRTLKSSTKSDQVSIKREASLSVKTWTLVYYFGVSLQYFWKRWTLLLPFGSRSSHRSTCGILLACSSTCRMARRFWRRATWAADRFASTPLLCFTRKNCLSAMEGAFLQAVAQTQKCARCCAAVCRRPSVKPLVRCIKDICISRIRGVERGTAKRCIKSSVYL